MKQLTAGKAARAVVRLSAAMAARSPHDAGAGGAPVHVTDPTAISTLERGFLRVLSTDGAPRLRRVSEEVARAFPRHAEDAGSGTSYLAVALDRQGHGTFLLRRIPGESAGPVASVQQSVEEPIFEELRQYLRAVSSANTEEP